MYLSTYTFLLPFAEKWLVLNPLTGAVDLAENSEAEMIAAWRQHGRVPADSHFLSYLIERGYAFPSREEEEKVIAEKAVLFREARRLTPVQLQLVPTYNCNLRCPYCFQRQVGYGGGVISQEAIAAFFAFVDDRFAAAPVKPYLTLFGGEPLIDRPDQRRALESIVAGAAARGLELAVVTNGYHLLPYLDLLAGARIREIQVTVDGVGEVHNRRRPAQDGGDVFAALVRGIEEVLQRGWPVNLRVVVDRRNLEGLVDLAAFVESRGWLDLPPSLFKTQIGRYYEIEPCPQEPEYLLGQAELWQAYADLAERYPLLRKFHRPDFKGIRELVETGEMPAPTFDTCPALKNEWLFGPEGDIYPCTAACGRRDLRVGSFYPQVELAEEAVRRWQQRDIFTIPGCRDCQVALICGGGCGVVAARRNNGDYLAPDCRPIKEILAAGIKFYRQEILQMAEE